MDRNTGEVTRRLLRSLGLVVAVVLIGTIGYTLLGFNTLDALYQTTINVTTVGFREVEDFGPAEKWFTIIFLFAGVGVVLYALTSLLAFMVEGYLGNVWGQRKMTHQIDQMSGHAIICGWGRVGRATAHQLHKAGQPVVVVDSDDERLADCPSPHLAGDATLDDVLRQCGISRASTLVASLDTDASSLFVTLTARALNPRLTVIARARTEDAEQKFRRAGADRVVNPQRIGGNRIAAFALQPHVVDFLDVAMHDAGVEFRLEEVPVSHGPRLAGSSVRDTRLHEGDGALLLALRQSSGGFITNPPGETVIRPGDVVIAIGTGAQVAALRRDAAAG